MDTWQMLKDAAAERVRNIREAAIADPAKATTSPSAGKCDGIQITA